MAKGIAKVPMEVFSHGSLYAFSSWVIMFNSCSSLPQQYGMQDSIHSIVA